MKYIVILSAIVYAVFNPQDSSKYFSTAIDGANKLVVEKIADMPEVQKAVQEKLSAVNEARL
jgi:hypothetical protein